MTKVTLIDKINSMDFEYRSEVKKEYLINVSKYRPEKTAKMYASVVSNIIDVAERANGKEWADFSESMVDGAFIMAEAKSIITLQSYLSIIKDYLTATKIDSDSLQKGYNYTMSLDKEKLIENNYINNMGEKYRYITPQEFENIIENKPADALGKCLFILLYLGVKGTNFSEIYNIKEDDIDLESGMVIGEDRVLCTIPQKYIHYFKKAMSEEVYTRYNADGSILNTSTVYTGSEYFVKRRVGKSKDGTMPPDGSLISNTLVDIQRSIGNKYLTGVSLYLSGEAYRLMEGCDMRMPTNQDLISFRKETGSKLSFVSMKTICSILLEKLGIQTPE